MDSEVFNKEYTVDFVDHWDDLINWKGRAKAESGFFQDILKKAGAKDVADVACGTGYHAIDLAKSGFNVVAADGAATMIEKTKENAARHDADLQDIVHCYWHDLPDAVGENRFDALICLGNAFTHLFEHDARVSSLAGMFRVLKPGGLAIIDHRNYDEMLDKGFSTKHEYYYTGNNVEARPVVLNDKLAKFQYDFPDGTHYHLSLFPLRVKYMDELLRQAGFVDITRYGDFETPYEQSEVDFIQQVARKPART